MSTTTSRDLQVKTAFADGSTRTYTLPNISDSINRTNVIAKVEALNAGTDEKSADFKRTFVSNDGDALVSITSAIIVTTTEEAIYNG